MSHTVQLRLMTPADLDFADSLRALAGWNQTRTDWLRLLAHEPQGCFIAEWDGAVAGTATTTCYGTEPTIRRSRRREEADLTTARSIRLLTSAATRAGENCDLAWIGMVLVHPDFRRRGIGAALLQRCLDYLSGRGIRCVKLDATPLGRPVYERLGFQSEWALARWEHPRVGQTATVGASDCRPWQDADADAIDAIDRRAFGVSRQRLIQALARDSLHALVHASSDGRLDGFGTLREGARALYLGPIIAASPAAGSSLVQALLTQAAGQPVFWDIPEPNTTAVALAQKLGFVRQRPLLRMFRGENEHPGNPQCQFAIADPAIG